MKINRKDLGKICDKWLRQTTSKMIQNQRILTKCLRVLVTSALPEQHFQPKISVRLRVCLGFDWNPVIWKLSVTGHNEFTESLQTEEQEGQLILFIPTAWCKNLPVGTVTPMLNWTRIFNVYKTKRYSLSALTGEWIKWLTRTYPIQRALQLKHPSERRLGALPNVFV